MLGLLVLLIVGSGGAVYLGQKSFVEKNSTLSHLKAKSQALESQEHSLVQAKKDIEQYSGLETVAKSIVPHEKDQARTVRELVSIADSLGIKIGSISFPSSNLGDAKKADSVSQVEPVKGVPGLYELDVNVTASSDVDFQTLVDFLNNLENNRRTSTISSITITPVDRQGVRLLNFGLTVRVFIKP